MTAIKIAAGGALMVFGAVSAALAYADQPPPLNRDIPVICALLAAAGAGLALSA